MEKPKVLIAHHDEMPRGTLEVHETDNVMTEGQITMDEATQLVFMTECIGEDLFALGVIRMIAERGKQALVIVHPEEKIPGLTE